ncbi:MAG: 30S ribosomal protein S6--L-glutamate ligase [Pseudomonadota bacterium]|nr:30S ribosomal protein S6--L-glutamate ligase [Gammaproteobacteria bacterium]MEC8011801.1 30S ribosomal protein S6--L-glutamate ligase [Pseudomonadota bacterium]HBF06833.1 30S ribosomal protein S6--L-glutamate ligase [Gammaproteobacteria bacterium]|tara:strand:+ start:756 stop:1673 length:918 start_codon:yes stop_codon:yes gene_type:complete
MHIGILSRNPRLYSTRRLKEAALSRGHTVEIIDCLKCFINITANEPTVHYKSLKKKPTQLKFDAVIPRIGASITEYGCSVLRQFEVGETYTLNQSVAITRSRDKLRAHQILARKGVEIPLTSYAHAANATDELIEFVGGAPLIVKTIKSTHGKGVVLAENTKMAAGVINAFRNLDADFLVQEFIREAKGSDIRCFVVDDKVVAAMERTAQEGEFRSNLHLGGKATEVKLKPEERQLAVKAAKVMGLEVAGVDIIRSERGPLVLEVNSSPGLEGIETTTGKDVASSIIAYIEKTIERWPNRMREKG